MPTKTELQLFCTDVLHIKDAAAQKVRDPVALLNLFARMFHYHCPFTNITDSLMANILGNNRYKIDNVQLYAKLYLKPMLEGQGGTCMFLATTLQQTLQMLGYDSYVGLAWTRNKPGMEMMHFITFIRNVRYHGDTWLIDPGTRLAPLFQAVPLREVESHKELLLGRSSFVDNKYTWDGTLFRRYFKPVNDENYGIFYEFNLEDNSIYDGDQLFDYSNISKGSLEKYQKFQMERPSNGSTNASFWETNFIISGYPEGRAVLFVNNKIQIEDSTGRLVTTVIDSKDQLLTSVLKYYPSLKPDILQIYINMFWNKKYNSKL